MKRILSGVVAVLVGSTSALAADVYQPDVIQAPVVEQAAVSTGGWYLRGDLGYGYNKLRGARFFQGSNGLVSEFNSAEL